MAALTAGSKTLQGLVLIRKWITLNKRKMQTEMMVTMRHLFNSAIITLQKSHHYATENYATLITNGNLAPRRASYLPERTTVEDGKGETPIGRSEPYKRAAERPTTFLSRAGSNSDKW